MKAGQEFLRWSWLEWGKVMVNTLKQGNSVCLDCLRHAKVAECLDLGLDEVPGSHTTKTQGALLGSLGRGATQPVCIYGLSCWSQCKVKAGGGVGESKDFLGACDCSCLGNQ